MKINDETHYLWWAVDHEGEVLVTDKLRSQGDAVRVISNPDQLQTGCWLNNRAENSHQPFRRRKRGVAVDNTKLNRFVIRFSPLFTANAQS